MTQARTILVVDDAEDCAVTLNLALEMLPGVSILSAPSAERALAMLDRNGITAIVTDVNLPEMTGLDLISRIREQPRYKKTPIVVVSADADPSAPANALRAGADAYFAKPFSPGALRRRLEQLLEGIP
jgi:two-component system chemotaxis response regulator CheY